MSRIEEIRARLTAATPGKWRDKPSVHGNRYRYVNIGKDEAYTTLELEATDARLIANAPADLAFLLDRVEKLESALRQAEETWRLTERPTHIDPVHGARVEELGDAIGYGALMSSASASWRKRLADSGKAPVGGEFVAGPCHSMVVKALAAIRTALGDAP
jgi:hypothetical protein